MSSRNVSELIKQLFEISRQLEAVIPGRNFLPSGQQLGNLGEVLVAEAFGLNLCKAMTKGIDAHTEDGRMVQIKTVTSRAAGVHLTKPRQVHPLAWLRQRQYPHHQLESQPPQK